MTVGEAYTELSTDLRAIYEPREAQNIANLVIEHITGFANSNRILHKPDILTNQQEVTFQQIKSELLTGKPLQYALHETYFYGMKFYVDESVLIPRPETEELVEWILSDVQSTMYNVQCEIMDVGTGSGCIPIAIKKGLPKAAVSALDVSEKALAVAKKNAAGQNTEVLFFKADILDEETWKALPLLDYIISNPPYIVQSEAVFMNDNVLKYEPHLALFVEDKNPLQFYNAISSFGLTHLTNGGKLFFEINEAFGKEVVALLSEKGYRNIELRKDLQGKDRMVKAINHRVTERTE